MIVLDCCSPVSGAVAEGVVVAVVVVVVFVVVVVEAAAPPSAASCWSWASSRLAWLILSRRLLFHGIFLKKE